VKWIEGELPPIPGPRTRWEAVFTGLRARPGTWAEVAREPYAKAPSLSTGARAAIARRRDDGSYEYTVRREDGEAALYMRAVQQ